MTVQRINASQIDLLDTVLDKGIVVDAWACVSTAGIDLISADARIVVVSVEADAPSAAHLEGGSRPPPDASGTRRPTASRVPK
jgi:hypothetical protein